MRRRWPVAHAGWRALSFAMLLAACETQGETMRTVTVTIDETTLTLSVPEGLQAASTRSGLSIRPGNGSSRRGIYEMAITVGGATGPDATTSLDQLRGAGAEAIRYAVRREDGGSGGEEVTLIASRACADTVIALRFVAQGEDGGEVDLEPAFTVLESARCVRAR